MKGYMYQDIYRLYRGQKAGFISCIKVYAYAYEHGPEGKIIFSPYHQILQEIIIQDAVIDPFTGCSFAVDILILL